MDLTKVPIRKMDYHDFVKVPKEFYQNTDLLDMKEVELSFSISFNASQEEILVLHGKGEFQLEDARTLEPVWYPFEVSMEEKIDFDSEMCGRFLENSQNTLDILGILWENIVLEIPICYTVSEEIQSGGEEELDEIDPRLAPLRELLNQEKE